VQPLNCAGTNARRTWPLLSAAGRDGHSRDTRDRAWMGCSRQVRTYFWGAAAAPFGGFTPRAVVTPGAASSCCSPTVGRTPGISCKAPKLTGPCQLHPLVRRPASACSAAARISAPSRRKAVSACWSIRPFGSACGWSRYTSRSTSASRPGPSNTARMIAPAAVERLMPPWQWTRTPPFPR
jgi:hypothetical protein